MTGFQTLADLIQEKLERGETSHTEYNPLYVTKEEAAALLEAARANDGYDRILPALDILASLFNLDEFEKQTLFVILAPEVEPGYGRIFAYLQDDLNKKFPTISLISSLLSKNRHIFSYLSPDAPLRAFRLIQFIDTDDGTPLLSQPIKIEESVRDFIFGHYRLDNRVQAFCRLFPRLPEGEISAEERAFAQKIAKGADQKKRFLFHFHGNSTTEKKKKARQIASELGYGLLTVNTLAALKSGETFTDLMPLLYREAILSGTLLYFDNLDALLKNGDFAIYEAPFFDSVDRFSWLTFFSSQRAWSPNDVLKEHIFFDSSFKKPEYDDSLALWEKYLKEIDPSLAEDAASKMARMLRFGEDEIAQTAHLLKARQFSGEPIDVKTVYEICRKRVSDELNHLAQPIKSDNTLHDIVLPKEQTDQLKNLISHYNHQRQVFETWGFKKFFQSQGIGVLFTGPPGTGKTMAASILANEMGLDLYRIELSQIVSKYVGETEKNLSKIFEAAEGSGVMLFFDEADAVFGKRTEVKDAHDRYANIEVSYLLQRIEEYDGPVILATNYKRNIDDAFVRRLRFIVEFPFPDEAMREMIWRKVFPAKAPLQKDIDFAFLAKNFRLSGANIRNIALFSAFYAAEKRGSITMKQIIMSIKKELQKSGKTYKPSDFGVYRNLD